MIFRSPWPDIPAPGETMCDVVLASAKLYGEKVALIEGETGRTVTYAQLVARGERVAAGLAQAGLAHGEPVAVVLPNSIEFVLAWLGALLAGGWVVPINPAYTPAEMEMQIRDAGARIGITCAECAKTLEGVVEKLFVTGANFDELLENRAPRPDVRIQPDDLATMPYSSGTTGKPKGVRLTHANLVTNIRQLDVVGWVRHDDVMVVIFPLYHVGGLNCMLTVFFSTWLRTMMRWIASLGMLLPATSIPVFETRNFAGARYCVACFECISRYIAP
jgi:acyl-CoA synthetase (AMP-forming)/AMP-acid ligase II